MFTVFQNMTAPTLQRLRWDKVWLTTVFLLAAIALFDPPQLLQSATFVGQTLLWMVPLIAFAALLAAYSRATGLDQQIARIFSARPVKAIFLASVFGALSPFCSCGVVALVAGMLSAGVPLAPVMAFWIASPIMDPEMFVLTAAILGVPFALAKTVSAFLMGVVSGGVVLFVTRFGWLQTSLRQDRRSCRSLPVASSPVWRFWQESERQALFQAEAKQTFLLVLKWLTLAFVLESLMLAYISNSQVAALFIGEEWWRIPVAVLIGAPLYLNGYAAVPLASGLLEQGMQAGAVLAFLVGGGVTSIPAAMSVFALVRKPVFIAYLVVGMLGAVSMGSVFQLWL